jgi:hypothetical protein
VKNGLRINTIIALLFAWSVLWVPTFLIFLAKHRVRGFQDIENHYAIPYLFPILSIVGALSLGAACLVKLIDLIRKVYGPLWLNAAIIMALVTNYWHWTIIGNIVSV